MIININFKLHKNYEKRAWVDDTILPEPKLKRLFLTLSVAKTLDEQLAILRQNGVDDDYNASGERTMFYVQGDKAVKVCICNYDEDKKKYRRGCLVDTISL